MTIYNIKPGQLLHFSEGEYSDYHVLAHFVALKAIDNAVLRQTAINSGIRMMLNSGEDFDPDMITYDAKDGFINELIRSGYLLEVDSIEVYLGSYGSIDSDIIEENELSSSVMNSSAHERLKFVEGGAS